MNSRLEELLRQRELMREHLRWLENEIAGAQGNQGTPPTAATPEVPTTAPEQVASAPSEDLSPLPEPDLRSVHNEVKSGCLIYSLILFGGLAALIVFIYWKY